MSTPQQTINLTSLLSASASPGSSSPNNNPTDDTVLQTLQARSRSDLPYTYLSTQTLIVVNPLRTLGNLSDASAQEYVEKYTLGPGRNETNPKGKEKEGGMRLGVEQPHLYDLAGKVWSMMKRRKESQAIVYRYAKFHKHMLYSFDPTSSPRTAVSRTLGNRSLQNSLPNSSYDSLARPIPLGE